MLGQIAVLCITALLLLLALWFWLRYSRRQQRERTWPVPEWLLREGTVSFTPSHRYRQYRSPVRSLRRQLGWLSGRQWTKTRKHRSLSAFYTQLLRFREQFRARFRVAA